MLSNRCTPVNKPRRQRVLQARVRVGLPATALLASCYVGQAYAANCEGLASLRIPNTTIKSAQVIAAGNYQPPGSATVLTDLPNFCRVTATVNPVPGSTIGIEVWLPSKTWNHKYQQSGNHGIGGTFYWGEMVRQIQRGYATGVTDAGHTATAGPFDTAFAFTPQRNQAIVDFAYRAVHELAEKAKVFIAAYYGRAETYSYFNGCSDGGREAIKAAQLYPRDFDGIIAGSAVANYTHNATEQLVTTIDFRNAGIIGPQGPAILALAQAATTAQCDALDGVTDGLIGDPRRCHWNPNAVVCKAGQSPSTCITQAQADAIAASERTLRDPKTGKYVMAGMSPGSEHDEVRFGFTQGLAPFGIANYRIGLNDPNWDGSTFNLSTDLPKLDRTFGDVVNQTDPDLRAFKRAGGKLIQWHGWDDVVTQPKWTVKYYNEVVDVAARGSYENAQDFYRLFMMPGVGHCGGGIGPDNIGAENQTAYSQDPKHDVVSALEAWVERGNAPDKLIATQYNNNSSSQGVARQRLLCPYPSAPVYKGGDINAASSFVCSSQSSRRDDRLGRDDDDLPGQEDQ